MSGGVGWRRHLDLLAARGPLRVLNWHTTPAERAGDLREYLRRAAARWEPLDLAGLDALFDGGPRRRPAFLPVFYEGCAEPAEVAAQVCAEVGVVGWFAVCTGFVDCPPAEQETFARSHWIALADGQPERDRLALTWAQVAELSREHVVFPHTAEHAGIAETVTDADLKREVVAPKRRMDEHTGGDAAVFAWMGGTPFGTSERHDTAVRRAGYRYQISNTMVQRLA